MKKGALLERDAHQFLWDLGYLVFPRTKIHATRVTSKKSINFLEVTDLDVFGIRFGPFLKMDTFLIDCKHRSEGVFSQCLNALGLVKMLNINDLLVIRSNVTETVQMFSEMFGVRLVNKNEFTRRITRREVGSFSSKSYSAVDKLLLDMSKKTKPVYWQLTNALVDPNPYRRFKTLRLLYQDCKREFHETVENKPLEYIMYRIIVLSLLSLAEMAGEVIHLSEHHFRNFILSKMIGDVNLKLRLIDRLQFNGPDDKEIALSDLAPSYFDRLSYLVDKMRIDPFLVQFLLRYNDFVIHEFGIFDRKMDWSIVEHEFGDIDRKSFSKWNLILLEILDEEKVLPLFAVELLT